MEALKLSHTAGLRAEPRPDLKVVDVATFSEAPTPEPAAPPAPPGRPPEFIDTSWSRLRADFGRRPVDWRWAKVRTLRDRPHLPLNLEEPLLEQASSFAHELEQGAVESHCTEPKERNDLRDAYAIFAGDQPGQRGILEAWLLTGLSDEDIAAKTGQPASVIQMYEKLFFDVRDRLSYRSFVSLHVLNLYPTPAADLASVLKFYAYNGGPVVLDYLVDLLIPGIDGLAGKCLPPREADLRTDLGMVSTLGLWVLPVTQNTFKGLMRITKHIETCSPTDLDQARKVLRKIQTALRQAVKDRSLHRTELVEFQQVALQCVIRWRRHARSMQLPPCIQ
jgi:hypothetical protein